MRSTTERAYTEGAETSDFHFMYAMFTYFCLVVDTNEYRQINQSTDNSVCIEMDLLNVGSEPVGMKCPYCSEDIMTRATYTNTSLTHIVAVILGVLFWWLFCCLIPYFVKRWKNVEHYCPSCHRFLGVYARKKCLRT